MPTSLTDVHVVNSTSYADVVGLELGLDRLAGEDTIAYLKRLYRAANSNRDHSYEGVLNEISLQLGLKMDPYIRITSTDPNALLHCSIGGLVLTSNSVTSICPLLFMDNDDVWTWFQLSDVVAKINSLGSTFGAVLLSEDGPALQLARQNNLFYTIADAVTQEIVWPYDVVGSEVGLVGMSDPEFPQVAARSNSALAYQVRESIQTLMSIDRSYWAK